MRKCILALAAMSIGMLVSCLYPETSKAALQTHMRVIYGDDKADHQGQPLAAMTANGAVELWHSSGGYWKYGDRLIYDRDLGNVSDADSLAEQIGQLQFQLTMSQYLRDVLSTRELVDVVISADTSKHPEVQIENLLEPGTVDLRIEGDKLVLTGKPKFIFYSKTTFERLTGGKVQFNFPIVDPAYGYNRYAIWTRDGRSLGAADGFFDPNDHNAPAPDGSGLIAPNQIISSNGHLADGINIRIKDSEGNELFRNSSDVAIGYNTLSGGGAVGIHLWYPIRLTFHEPFIEDIRAEFEPYLTSAVEGQQAVIGAIVRSSFPEDLENVPYRWTIIDVYGNVINPVTVTGHADALSGTVNLSADKEHLQYASFTMPNRPVKVIFEINPDGNSPHEADLTNNRIEMTIQNLKPMQSTAEFELDYHILSLDAAFDLSNSPIQASLSLPRGSWSGPAAGSLNIANGAPDLLRNFTVLNNPPVNEYSTVISRSPVIHATLRREDFGDDPLNGKWAAGPAVLPRSGSVSFGGEVSRRYTWTDRVCREDEVTDPETGEAKTVETCSYVSGSSYTTAPFNSGNRTVQAQARVYHGMEKVPPKTFRNSIETNTRNVLTKKLWWESEPWPVNVIRWMYHQSRSGSLTGATAVDGKYRRTFVQQSEGLVSWNVRTSMDQLYGPEREAARERRYDGSQYLRAVFASDADMRNAVYPIKSGYYFNPAGEYTVVVETVTFKPAPDDTRDHQDLVDAVIGAFRYESDLVYINQSGQAVNLQNEALSRSGDRYQREAASLTASDPTGVDGLVLLEVLDRKKDGSRYRKQVEELPHAPDATGYTHPYWKQVLEGYAESGTAGSYSNYHYVEYVKPGQKMYMITEQTTVTFRINPNNQMVYTHAHMSDGTYRVRAWIADVDLSRLAANYNNLGALRGIELLDEIEITVKGSMYDDIR